MTEPAKAAFLRYASQDAAAAQRICLLASLRNDPRYQAFLAKMKLTH
jgi:hypothetical protein